ncbi:sensor domain-containing diguanylate cyclase [Candidatus Solincola tengchongensis]|uniref:GGDEF domain-containing protein n=1 Tax=Candidatus Solincola tengchongensis TaxID=2900693 RepID=UPI00257AEB4A|nr:sensor domain-containing diguanylate cyclase [Candidatus Solincola tengchongensis]
MTDTPQTTDTPRGSERAEVRLAFAGFNSACGRLARVLAQCEMVKITGILAGKLPPDWPSEVEPPPLFTARGRFVKESAPHLILAAEGTDTASLPAGEYQILEIYEDSPLALLLEKLTVLAADSRRLSGELQEITAVCAGAGVVEAYSDPLPKLSQLLDRAMALSGAREGMVLFPGEEVDSMRVVLARGERLEAVVGGSLEVERSICGRAFDTGAVVHHAVEEGTEESAFLGVEEGENILALPMRAEGRVVGILALVFRGLPQTRHLPLLALVADQGGLAVLIARLYSELETNVVTDSASGLYNRNFFLQRLHEEISRARRYSLNVCLVFLEIDGFEEYVERNGRFLGDLVISDVGSIIRRNTREVDTAARYQGHTFAVLLPETRRLGAMRLAERIRKVVEEYPFPSREKKEVESLTMSAGVASYPACADSEETLLERALAALAAARTQGPNRVLLYAEGM